jgi:TIR domain-containing protein
MARSAKQRRFVFVSHSGPDTWVARQIAREIKVNCRGEVFLDEAAIQVGADFEEEILGSLQRADELLVLMTPWALDRPYVWAELGAAWFRRIPIVVVLHGLTAAELQSQPGVTVFLKKRNLIDLNDLDTYFEQLKQRSSA